MVHLVLEAHQFVADGLLLGLLLLHLPRQLGQPLLQLGDLRGLLALPALDGDLTDGLEVARQLLDVFVELFQPQLLGQLLAQRVLHAGQFLVVVFHKGFLHAFEVGAHAVHERLLMCRVGLGLVLHTLDLPPQALDLLALRLLLLEQRVVLLVGLAVLALERLLHGLHQLELVVLELAALGDHELLDARHLLLHAHLRLDLRLALGQLGRLLVAGLRLLPQQHVLFRELVVVLLKYVLRLERLLQA